MFSGLSIGRFAAVACVCSVLACCTQLEIEDHSYEFNAAVGSTDNRLLLLNAVRASKDYPIEFSKISSYTGQGNWGVTVSPTLLSFISGGKTFFTTDPKPSATLKSGIQTMGLADLNTDEAQKLLKTQLTQDQFSHYYTTAGLWDKAILYTILVDSISVRTDLKELMDKEALAVCNETATLHRPKTLAACIAWISLEMAYTSRRPAIMRGLGAGIRARVQPPAFSCEDGPYRRRPDVADDAHVITFVYANSAASKCSYLAMRTVGLQLLILDFDIYQVKPAQMSAAGQKPTSQDQTTTPGQNATPSGQTVTIDVQVNGKPANSATDTKTSYQYIFGRNRNGKLNETFLKARKIDLDGNTLHCADKVVYDQTLTQTNSYLNLMFISASSAIYAIEKGTYADKVGHPQNLSADPTVKEIGTLFSDISKTIQGIAPNQMASPKPGGQQPGGQQPGGQQQEGQQQGSANAFKPLTLDLTSAMVFIPSALSKIEVDINRIQSIRNREDTEPKPLKPEIKKAEDFKKVLYALAKIREFKDRLFKMWPLEDVHADKLDMSVLCQSQLPNVPPLEFTFRSPEQIVRYLGGLIALQMYSQDKFVPTIWPDNLDVSSFTSSAQNLSDGGVPLFRVERGVPKIDAAVSVIDSEAEYFYVPRPQYGSKLRDRSLEVFALAQDVLNSAVSKQALPAPTTFALTPAQ